MARFAATDMFANTALAEILREHNVMEMTDQQVDHAVNKSYAIARKMARQRYMGARREDQPLL